MTMKIIHAIFSICCHQHSGRSPHYSDEIFPLCYRCAGLYFGIFSSYLFLFLKRNATHFLLDRKTGLLLVLFTIPLCIDGLANFTGLWSTSGEIRCVTGILCGIVLPLFLVLIRNSSVNAHLLHKINYIYIIVPLTLCSCFIFLFIFTPSYFIFHSMAIIAVTGMILFFLNMIITLFYLKSPVFSEQKY